MSLSATTIAEALSVERRRLVIRLVDEHGAIRQTDLVDKLTELRNDGETNGVLRKREFTSLYQNHIPKLDECDIINWDGRDQIEPGPEFEIATDALDALDDVVDDDPKIVTDGSGWFDCDLCGASYPDQATALRCCGDQFDDDDDLPLSPVAVDEHGSVMMTDGTIRGESDV